MLFTQVNQVPMETQEVVRPKFIPNKAPSSHYILLRYGQGGLNSISPLVKQVMLLRMLAQAKQLARNESALALVQQTNALNKRNIASDVLTLQSNQNYVTAGIEKVEEEDYLREEKRNSGDALMQFNREKKASDEFLANPKRQYFRKISLEVSSMDQDSTHYSFEKDASFESASLTKKRFQLDEGIVIDNYLISDDLNDCVEALLRKDGAQVNDVKSIIKHNLSGKAREKQRRFRKGKDQNQLLQRAYDQDPNWDKVTIQKLSEELGLKESQIYKWNWDKKKKNPFIAQKQDSL